MGVWGAKSFENDDALDWVCELSDATDAEPIRDALNVIVECGEEYLELSECSAAVAAAEVVAALKGFPDLNPPEEVTEWMQRHKPTASPALIALALKALEKILSDSELKDLWDESESAAEWYDAMSDLSRRLKR